MKKLLSLITILAIVISPKLFAQDKSLNEVVAELTDVAAKKYLAPISNAIGSNLNSGWLSRVPEATKLKFHLDIRVTAMGTFFADADKDFTASGKFRFNDSEIQTILANSGITSSSQGYQQIFDEMRATKFDVTFTGPTIAGKNDNYLKITFPGQTIQGKNIGKYDVQIKEVNGYLEDIPAFPLLAPQITIGTVMGTNLSVRYIKADNIKDLGDIKWFGIGGVHNPSVWFPNPLPVDIGIAYFTQDLKLGDIIENKSSVFGAYIGKTFGGAFAIIPYAGFTIEKSTTTIKYNYVESVNGVDVKVPVNFDLEGENKTGVMVGCTFKLGIILINADYKLSKSKTATVGISLGW